MTNALEERARRVNGLPSRGRDARPLGQRILTSPWTWVTVAAALVFATCLYAQFSMITTSVLVEGCPPETANNGLSVAAVRQGAIYAAPTLAFWIVLYLIADRFRPQRPLVWFLALGWGGCVATWLALNANDWAASNLGIDRCGVGDPAAAARVAIFVAPFVEEGAKATVLFFLAILVRNRLTSKVSLIALGGLSAAAFAFTENIIYYAQVIQYASTTIDVGDANAAIANIVQLRGVMTAFGHPLFTMMTATGVAIALRTRSKVVRILAPLAGYLIAAFLHMVFNSQSGMVSTQNLAYPYVFVALPLVLVAVIYAVRQELAQGKLIRARLTDYVRVGWLTDRDPVVFSRLRTRGRALAIALTRGWRPWLATVRLQRAMTEMAYLRDAEASGLIDEAATLRALDLLDTIRAVRPAAVDDPRGQRLNLPRLSLPGRRQKTLPPPSPYDFGGWPPPSAGSAPVTGYSAVDPSWGPPPG